MPADQATWCTVPAPGRGRVSGASRAGRSRRAPRPAPPSRCRLARSPGPRAAVVDRGLGVVGAHRVEALQGVLGGHLGVLGDQRRIGNVDHHQLVLEALGVEEHQRVVVARALGVVVGQPRGPEVQRVGGADPPHHPVDHSLAGLALWQARVLEEGEVRAGVALLVGVEEVVDRRVVLVDALLDQAQPHHARVEVHVARGVAGDRGDVVDAFELHALDHRPTRKGRPVRGAPWRCGYVTCGPSWPAAGGRRSHRRPGRSPADRAARSRGR